MRVLLTGGAGFIGSQVAERLLERSHEVIVVDDLSSGKRENVPEGARFCEEDVRSGCEKVFQELRPEVLCHQAAHIDVHRSVLEPDFDVDVNVLGTVRLLQNCVRYGVGRVVFASSGGPIYGEQNEFPLRRTIPNAPSRLMVSRSWPGNATCTTTTSSTACPTRRYAMRTSMAHAKILTARRGSWRSSPKI